TEYDPAGNPIVQIDAKGNRTTTYYDAIGRPVAVIDALGNVWIYGHCAEIAGGGTGCTTGCAGGGAAAPGMGSFCELTDPLGNLTRQDFDALGRVERMTDPLGHQTTIAYDAAGRREAVTDALGRTTRYEYDVQGRLTAVIEANGARTEYSYDGNGNMTNMKDAEGRDWPRTYDEMNRLKTESDPLGNTTQYFYDALGNLERKTKPDGQEITYDYDLRRLIAVNLPGAAVESFGYDTLGRRTSMANAEVALSYMFDELNRLTQTTNHTLTQSIGYEYDDNNNLTRMIGPRGAVEYFYDELNRLVEQRDPVTGVFLYEYDNLGRRTALHYPNGLTTEYSYGVASRLESIITRNEQGEVVDGYSYSYDPVGNRLTMIGLHDGVRHEYEYDEVYRLSRWNRGPSRFEAYTYDNVGNRATLTDEAGSITYDYDLANRLVSEVRQFTDGTGVDTIYAWDANGNLTTKTAGSVVTVYQWDALDRMVGLTGPGGANSYGYDPEGIRFRETNNGETENFLLAKDTHGFGDIVAVFHGSGALSTYFTHGMGVDEPLAQVNGQGMHYLHRDGLGSVTALSGTDGYISGAMSYAAFGDVEDQVGMGSRHGYTSRELDATELMYYRTRYYQPRVGRFASRESFRGSPLVPASLHDYQYVFNNPIIHGDPTGQQPLRLWPAIAKAVEYLMRFLYMRLAKAVPITNVPHGWSQGMFFAGIAVGLGICGFFTSTSEDAAYYRNWAFGLALMLVSIAFMTSVLILAGQLKYSMHAAYRILVTSMFFFGWALGCHVVYVWREQRK
ncbi:MAG: RHS repeat protein, partial [bacterium]|nr:RHS repeat protein [bacterium]